ncbi:MAG: tetratricopeptide repeat protein [Pseudomonadota bacterium]
MPRSVAALDVQVLVAPPAIRFTPSNELVVDTELKLAPEEFELSQQLRPLLRAKDYGAALSLLEASPEDGSPALVLLRAQLLALAGRRTNAIAAYEQVLAVNPDARRAQAGVGTLYLMAGDTEKAQRALAAAVRLGVQDSQTFAQLGYLNSRLNQPWGAAAAYQQALMLAPGDPELQRALLDSLVRSGNLASARTLVDELLTRSPDTVGLWQQSANLALKEKDTLAAVAALEVALRLGDEDPKNVGAAAQLHLDLGNYSRAAELLDRALVSGDAAIGKVFVLVDWLIRAAALGDATRLLDRLQGRLDGMSPSEASAYHGARGSLAEARSRGSEAKQAYRRALKSDPANGAVLLRLATLQLESGELARARINFERAEALPSVRRAALLGQAQVAIERREFASALKLVERVQAEFPNGFELEPQIQSLKLLVAADGDR